MLPGKLSLSERIAEPPMTISFHKGDLPDGVDFGDSVAIDTETLGLVLNRDRLCLVQLSRGDGTPCTAM